MPWVGSTPARPESIRVAPHGFGDRLVGHLEARGMARDAALRGDKETALDSGRVHAPKHVFVRNAAKGLLVDTDLVDEKFAPILRSFGEHLRRHDIDDGVDGAHVIADGHGILT